MKKLIFGLLFICIAGIVHAQNFFNQFGQGNANSEYYQNGASGAVLGFEFRSIFADTSSANSYLGGQLKNRPGFVIRCGDDLYMRSADLQIWNKINITSTPIDTTGQFVKNVTQIDDTTIRVFLGATQTDIVIHSAGGGGSVIVSDSAWSLTGNAGTDTATNFIGTTDDVPLRFKVNNTRMGLLEVDYNNIAFGSNALVNIVDGTLNAAYGYQALKAKKTGVGNVGIGANADYLDTAGSYNVAIGFTALAANLGNSSAVAIGYKALNLNKTDLNVAVGSEALSKNVTGTGNTAVGATASKNSTGSNNTAFGASALSATGNTSSFNTAIGLSALAFNTTGDANTAVGDNASYHNTSGQKNSVLGAGTLEADTSGSFNSGVGQDWKYQSTSGDYNSGIGYVGFNNMTTGSGNSGVGYRHGGTLTTGSYNSFLGYGSGFNASQKVDALRSMALGVDSYTDCDTCIVIGATYNNKITGYGSIFFPDLPAGAGTKSVRWDASLGLVLGDTTAVVQGWSLTGNAGTTAGTNFIGTTDDEDIVFKRQSNEVGRLNNTNSSYGYQTLVSNTTGTDNTAIGEISLNLNEAGSNNIGLGAHAGRYNVDDSFRLYINSIQRSNILGDTTKSIIYGAQDATASNQRLYLNSQVYAPYLSTGAGTKSIRYDEATGQFLITDTTTATATPDWQTTLNVSPVLTQDNQIESNSAGVNILNFGKAVPFNEISFDATTVKAGSQGNTSTIVLVAQDSMILSTNGSIRFNDPSLASASNGYVWTLTDAMTGSGAWAASTGGGGINIYNTDSLLAGDRTVDMDGYTLQFTNGSVGIGGTPDASSILDLQSTSLGFLMPRMTEAQRDLISPVSGLLVYNTDQNKINFYDANTTTWTPIGNGIYAGSGSLSSSVTTVETGTNILEFSKSGLKSLVLDNTADAEQSYLQAYNTTGSDNYSQLNVSTGSAAAYFSLSTNYQDGTNSVNISGQSDATVNTITYYATQHLFTGSVGIGGTPDASAILDVQSTTQGLLVPRMTETERDAISSPATGLMIFQTDGTAGFYYWDGASWTAIGGSGGGANTALSNLASVAINTSLLPATDDAIDLGDPTHQWRDLYLTGASIYMAGNKVLSTAGLALGAGSITMSGSIGVTGTRVTKGWFTDAEFSNMPTVGGTSIASTFAPLTSPTFATSITGSYLTASELLGTDGSKNIVSLPTATYPSLTELSYVKGATSSLQTQLGTKVSSVSGTASRITSTGGTTPVIDISATYDAAVSTKISDSIDANAVTIRNPGTGDTLFVQEATNQYLLKSLVAGSNITLTPTDTTIVVASTGGGGSTTTTDNRFDITSDVLTAKKTPQTLSDGATITWDASAGYNARVTLGGNRTLAFSNLQTGDYYTLTVVQDGTGFRSLTLPNGSLAPLNLKAGDSTTITFYYRNTGWNIRSAAENQHWLKQVATRTLTSTTSSQKLFDVTTNGAIYILEPGEYKISGMVYLTGMSGTSGNTKLDVLGGGTATLTSASCWFDCWGIDNSTPSTAAAWGGSHTSGATISTGNVVTAGTGTACAFEFKGEITVTAAGTIIPSVALTTAAAATVGIGTSFYLEKIGTTTQTNNGNVQ